MKAISLWQPWASLWCSDAKIHETRHWPTPHVGPTAVHAAKKLVRDVDEEVDEACMRLFGEHWRRTLPRGALIGVVEITECLPTEEVATTDLDYACGDFSPDRFAWRRGAYRLLLPVVPYVGRQGFFNVADELVGDA